MYIIAFWTLTWFSMLVSLWQCNVVNGSIIIIIIIIINTGTIPI